MVIKIMKKTMKITAALILSAAVGLSAQQTRTLAAIDREAAAQITALSAPLHYEGTEPNAASRRDEQIATLTDSVRRAVDQYIESRLRAAEGSDELQARLQIVLADHKPNPEYADLPLARVATLRSGPGLVVAYTLVRGPHNDAATVRGYRWNVDRFELAATAGEDFDGYNMFKAELRSPVPGELWLLAWGQAQTFNGKRVRFRIYAFDGQGFRTMWAPDDMFNASIRISVAGFAIDHEIPSTPNSIHDEYRVAANGPVKIN
jgi:hypothetical protein